MVQTSMVKRSQDAKKNAGVSVIAMQLAKNNQDQLWKKASKFKAMFMAAKMAINRKYGPSAKVQWAKKQSQPKPSQTAHKAN